MHSPFFTGLYASEGCFMKQMEANKRFVTRDPNKATLFYLPFSSQMLEETLYVQNSHNHKNLVQYLHNYVEMIAGKYTFWNRTGGADHFLVGCHDWVCLFGFNCCHYQLNLLETLTACHFTLLSMIYLKTNVIII